MRKSVIIYCIFICITVFISCSSNGNIEPDVQAIDSMTDEYVQAISVGDLEAMMNLMDDNFVMIPPNESVRRWEEAIREWYKSGFDRFHYKNAAYPTDEIKVFWDWSMKRGNFKATLEPKMGGNSIHIHIKAIHMLTKQSDGSWRISHAIWNNNPTAD